MNQSINKYLNSGPQTEITSDIQKIANDFNEKGLDLIFEILRWIHLNFKRQKFDVKLFRNRTADKIIKDKLVTGCSDFAIVFITLSRAKNIPTKYVETIKRSWLEIGNEERLEGHIFAKCFVDKKWYIVNPEQGSIVFAYNQYVVYKEGLDSWDIGIHNFDDLKKQFLKFKKDYPTR